MADEITITSAITIDNGALDFTAAPLTERYTQTGKARAANSQTIGTTEEALDLADGLTTPGWGVFTNLDATNYCELGVVENSVFRPFARLEAGKRHPPINLAAAAGAIYAKANTAPVVVDFVIFQR